jgi:Raf kinase inhibitor-like YbhB/YbcL family protein
VWDDTWAIDSKEAREVLEKLPEAIGHALEHQRAGMEKILFHGERRADEHGRIDVVSTAFAAGAALPRRFTADGAGVSPPLSWHNVPPQTAALALIVEDADSPTPEPLVHAIVVDIDPAEVTFVEGLFSGPADSTPEKLGRNSFFSLGWLPPDPPPGHGVHRYAFQVFALGAGEPLSNSPGRREVAAAIHERSIGRGCLIGTYQREIPLSSADRSQDTVADPTPILLPAETA